MGRLWFARLLGVSVLLALPSFGFSYAGMTFGGKGIVIVSADDSTGDRHSNCHTGSKGRGAGGNDKQAGGEAGDCTGVMIN